MASNTHTSTEVNNWLLRIVTPLGYAIGVGGPVIVIILAVLGKLPS